MAGNISRNSHNFSEYLHTPVSNSFFCSPVTQEECSKIVSNLKKSSTDINSIPVSLFKRILPYITDPLTNLINNSFKYGIFPECLKSSLVTPIFKSGDNKNVDNFRPISVFSFYAKIFERCMVNRITKYLSKFNLISPQQFGFTKGKSTSDAVNSILDYIYSALNEKKYALSVFLDLKKAFDCVDRPILIRKLEYYGFRGRSLDWFRSYLRNRAQRVKIGESISEPLFVDIGLPQGSIMAPILFLIYINDIVYASNHFFSSMFADETALVLKYDILQI